MGRLSLAIGRQKGGGDDERPKPRNLRSSLKGLLGIPGSERASVDLGDIGELVDEQSASSTRNSQNLSFLQRQQLGDDDAKGNVAETSASRRGSRVMGAPQGAGAMSEQDASASSGNSSHVPLRASASAATAHMRAEIAPGLLERSSINLDRDSNSDDKHHGWRRRGSLLSSRLALPLRKDASSGSSINSVNIAPQPSRVLVRKESTTHVSTAAHKQQPPPPQPQQQQQPAESTGKSPFWRGSSALRIAGSGFSESSQQPPPPPQTAAETVVRQERTHRSSSVPFLTPIPSSASAQAQAAGSPSKPMASPYLRAVNSGLGKYNLGSSRLGGSPKGFASSRPSQEYFPSLTLAASQDDSSPQDSPTHATAALDKASGRPMTFLVSPRPRANTGAKRSATGAQGTLNSMPSRDVLLCKRTLSSSTIPSLELNTPSSPKAMSGTVDLSEFGIVTSPSASVSMRSTSNPPLPPSPLSTDMPARSVDSAQASAAFEPLREEDEPAPGDTVHETHHMEVQHDPRTGRKMINQYMIIRELGRGTHGKVKLAFDTVTGEYFAIKVIDKESHGRRLRPTSARLTTRPRWSHGYLRIDLDKMEKVKREIAILKKCRHPNVVRLREVIDDAHARRIYLVIEYMDGGEVAWRDADRLPVMPADKARSVFRDLVLGVEYLHYVGILHRDLKPQNLLCNKAGTVKISDFGVSFLSHRLSKRPPSASISPQSQLHRAALDAPHLHHCASQPVMGARAPPRTPDAAALRHKASAHSRVSGGRRAPSISSSEASSLRMRSQLQRSLSRSVRRQATMGMTDEFGGAGSPKPPIPGFPAAAPGDGSTAPVCKLPPEFMSADSNVYDPFDSSDSAEFFSSSSEEEGESDYGSRYKHSAFGGAAAVAGQAPTGPAEHSEDGGSESGIVFGVLPPQGKPAAGNDLADPKPPHLGHQRKGTLGEIDFAYDEKDEERELAKTAGTPAFFAPELCCTAEELAKVLKDEHARRQARSKLESQQKAHHGSGSSRAPSPALRGLTAAQGTDGEQRARSGGHGNRPASLFVESPLAGDGAHRIIKRHSALTSLLSRPFSSKGRQSTGNNSTNSTPMQSAQPEESDGFSDNDDEANAVADQPLPANLITPAIDIWAMGVTLYCLVYGRVPFQATTEFELFNVIPRRPLEFPLYLDVEEDGEDIAPMMFNMSLDQASSEGKDGGQKGMRRVSLPPLDPDLRDLLTRLLDKDFRTRITIDEIKRHPWVVQDLAHPSSWAKETDPTRRPSLTITSQEVEEAMVPKVRQRRGFRATMRHRISMLSPRAARGPAGPRQQHAGAKTKSSLDWLKIW